MCNTGSCPAQPDVMCGSPEMVDAASTGAVAYTPIPAEQNYDTVSWPVSRLAGKLFVCLVDWQVGWMVGWLVCLLVM